MDPNQTLAEIRALVARILNGDVANGAAEELAELVTGLDEWIALGGFVPDAWRTEARFHV